ncbi:DEAD/DEAH box helicase [Paenibacillus cisolokensis]|uniref:DEAD/DEAH box helicase n=1 Tax=Paenibacillus cisolokensis TaxID=1658519 RepID=UPI003D28691B
MRTTWGIRAVQLQGYWHSEGGVAILEDNSAVIGKRLRQVLFARHEASWYGSDIEEGEAFGRSIVQLSPLLAMDYLSDPRHVRLLKVEWSPRLLVLRKLAELLRTMLLNGWFVPDMREWDRERRMWKPAIPESEQGMREEWEHWLRQAEQNGDGGVKEWLGLAVEAIVNGDGAAGAAWRAVEASHQDSLYRKMADEDDWQVAVGLKRDTFPFRLAIQLSEPDASSGWRLAPAVRDRDGGEWMPLEQGADGEWRAADGRELPSEWLPLLDGKVRKEAAGWLNAAPELAAREGEAEFAGIRRLLTDDEAWTFLAQISLRLLQAGCPVLLPGWWETVRSRKLRLRAKVKSLAGTGGQAMFGLHDIVQYDWRLAVGEVDLSEEEFMRLAAENRRLMRIGGEWVHLDPADVDRIRRWMKRVGRKKGLTFRDVLELHLRGGASIDDGAGEYESPIQAEVELDAHLAGWLQQLQQTSSLPLVPVPAGFRGELRPYQLAGVSWLAMLRRFGLGACLADDMGLGKTVQFAAYLLHVKEQRAASGDDEAAPSLLICPTSVIGNWEKELERFAPSLNVVLHYGPRRAKGRAFADAVAGADLVITSYALAPLDEEELSGVNWNTLCLDEAQNIKNVYTKQSAAIRKLQAGHRVALTGTPMENRLTELWSICDFLNPGYLGSLAEFRKALVQPIERTRDAELIAGLQRWVKPIMLRRVKNDSAIQLSLPEKHEAKTYVSLTAEQGAVYENIVSDLLERLDKLSAMERRGLILASLTKLKQVCDHPWLLTKRDGRVLWKPELSNKTVRLLEMIEEIAAEGERCLVFTQFVEAGEQIRRLLEERLGMPVPYLNGSVPKAKRDEMIAAFQDPASDCCAFVLSVKAGGTGLNLTAANHVFHFDRWWNPAVENQATDRVFRIGQTKRVQVHKLITLGTLEERIDEMIDRKQSLSEQVVGQSEQWITELSTDELKELFALRRRWLNG